MSTITVGLVGKRAGSFVAGLESLPDVRIAAVCEPDAAARERLAARAGVAAAGQHADYGDLLDRARPDVVVLGTPMPLHVPQAVAALQRGAHVLSEVTAAVDLEQCRALVRAARAAERAGGARYMMAENYCYRKDVVLVRAMALAGLFGECYFAEGEYLHDVKPLHHLADGSPTWRSTWQVGKRGCTYGTHSLGPALEFFGPAARVVSVSCTGSGVHTNPQHVQDDTCLMVCQLNTGGLIKVRLDMLSNRPHAMAYYSLQGTRGAYEASRVPGADPHVWLEETGLDPADPAGGRGQRAWRALWEYERHLPEMWRDPTDAALRAGHGGGDYFIVRDFVTAIRDGAPPPIDVYRAMDYTVPGIISEQSIAAGGAPLPVPDLRDLDAAPGTPAPEQANGQRNGRPNGVSAPVVLAPAAPAAEAPRRQLRMWRPTLDGLPELEVPAGYALRSFAPGDEAAWGEIMSAEGGIGRDWTVEKVRERLIDRPQFEAAGLFFATSDAEGGRPVASACAWRFLPGPEGPTDQLVPGMGNVHMVCSLSRHRGHGLGRLVTLAVLRYLRDRGDTSADLTTDDFRLAAIKCYLGLGLVPASRTDPGRLDDHEARWGAVFTALLSPRPAAVP